MECEKLGISRENGTTPQDFGLGEIFVCILRQNNGIVYIKSYK